MIGKTFDTEAEKFDEACAQSLMSSKKTWGKLNPLFMDTRVFNQSCMEYQPELSKAQGLEEYEKQFDGKSNGSPSPFKSSQRDLNQSFGDLRNGQRITNDVTLMTALNSSINNLKDAVKVQPITSDGDLSKIDRNDPRLTYNRDSKASIPAYNIKATYN